MKEGDREGLRLSKLKQAKLLKTGKKEETAKWKNCPLASGVGVWVKKTVKKEKVKDPLKQMLDSKETASSLRVVWNHPLKRQKAHKGKENGTEKNKKRTLNGSKLWKSKSK